MRQLKRLTFTLAMALAAGSLAPAALAANFPGSDAAVRPQDDLFRHANGEWLAHAEIPGDKQAYGTFMLLREKSDAAVKALLEEASGRPVGDARRIGDFYAALMDLAGIEKAGLGPLAGELAAIAKMRSLDDVADMLGRLPAIGIYGPVAIYVSPDQKAPRLNTVYWTQAGLGMPDRDYYLKPGAESEALREAYRDYLVTLGRLSGKLDPQAARSAFDFETALAKIHWARVDRRDAVKAYNPVARTAFQSRFPGFPWARLAEKTGMPRGMGAIVREPSYVTAFAALAAETSVSTWKHYLTLRVLDGYAEYMGPRYREAHHRFHGEKLNGLTAMPPAWKRAVATTNDFLGEAIGKRYVAQHFPPAAKARMRVLVDNLLAVYKEGIETLPWMTPATRTAALDKLAKLNVKIGYPDRWREDDFRVARHDAVGNVMRAARASRARDMAEAGKPVDRSRWHMTPQTVNAYYDPTANEIVFPAAILQPPFFDLKGDDAYNYGAIGAVIGHEISHGFDDQGRRYDGDGRLRDWWTDADAKAFTARADRLIAQYDAYEPLPGARVNGRLTLGENIADLAGVAMAYRAYQRAQFGKASREVDGFSPDERFFYGYARIWRSKSRPEWLKVRLVSDPHSPEEYRINGVVTNLDAFHEAFGLRPGDRLYRQPEERVRIW